MKKLIFTLAIIFIGLTSAFSQNSISKIISDKEFMIGYGLGLGIPVSNMKDRYPALLFGNLSLHYKINNEMYAGASVFSSPEFAAIFPYNGATNKSGLTSISADFRYKFFTDKRQTSMYCNFGAGIYLTKDRFETTNNFNNTKTNINPGGHLGIGLFGNVSENLLLDVNSAYNLYYNSHLFELPKYSSNKIFNYVLISVSLKYFI